MYGSMNVSGDYFHFERRQHSPVVTALRPGPDTSVEAGWAELDRCGAGSVAVDGFAFDLLLLDFLWTGTG